MLPVPPETTYTLTAKPAVIVRDVDGAFIPAHADNIDWRHYEAWVAAGNTPNPYVPPTKSTNEAPP